MLKEYVDECMDYLDDYCTQEESYFLRSVPYEGFREEKYWKIYGILNFYLSVYPGLSSCIGRYIHGYMMEKFPSECTGDYRVIHIYSYMHHMYEEREELAELLKKHAPEDHRRINELLTKLITSTHNTGIGYESEIQTAVNTVMMDLAMLEKEKEIDFGKMHIELKKIEDALNEKGIHMLFFEIMHEQLTMYQQLLERI